MQSCIQKIKSIKKLWELYESSTRLQATRVTFAINCILVPLNNLNKWKKENNSVYNSIDKNKMIKNKFNKKVQIL